MTDEKETTINKLHITTTISVEYKAYLERVGVKTCDALARGVRAIMDGDKLPAINNELKFRIEKMSDVLRQQAGRITELEEFVAKLKEDS